MNIEETMRLGLDHHQAGRYHEAETVYRQVLKQVPGLPDALHLLGVLAQQVGQFDISAQLITRAIAARPTEGVYYANLAETYRRARRSDLAEMAARRAIELAPKLASAHTNLGVILQQKQQFDEAERMLRRAAELDPQSSHAWTNLGNTLMGKGDIEGAIAIARHAVSVDPKYAVGHNNLGAALERNDQLAEAEAEYRKAFELDPKFVEAINNVGSVVRRREGNLREAMIWWAKAIEVMPDYSESHWNLALSALALGDFETGWPQYEWRFKCDHSRAYWREYKQPRWTGFDLAGKTILLYPEQGFGDVIQFARFIPQVAARGGKVILQCHDELIELMKSTSGTSQVIGQNAPLPPFDTYLPLLSVPWVIGAKMEDLHVDIPYIQVDPVRKAVWAERVRSEPGKLKVGLVFKGRMVPDPKRSCRFAEFAPLADVEGVTFFSLQKGEGGAQLADAPPNMRVVNLDSELHDFADTAAALSNLDLLISIDTAAAHLAGALGVKTWTMIPFACDFRWMVDREDCPWYPGMCLFRQKRMDDWSDVIARMRDELRKLA